MKYPLSKCCAVCEAQEEYLRGLPVKPMAIGMANAKRAAWEEEFRASRAPLKEKEDGA